MGFVSSPSRQICQAVASPLSVQLSVAAVLVTAVQARPVGAVNADARVLKDAFFHFETSFVPTACTCT